ncbi:hypothetical protein RUND412_008137 [Rhizina undulata]
MGVLDLEEQLLFYGAYHSHPGNIIIHVICVPIIMFTAFVWATNTPAILEIPYFPLNLGTVAAILYSLLYILMEPVAGMLIAPLILGGAAAANFATETWGSCANWWAGVFHVVAWLLQFFGHGFYEGRAPALLDNLVQALFLAPFFVWFEVLFMMGYRPELRVRLDEGVKKKIEAFNNGKKTNGVKKE